MTRYIEDLNENTAPVSGDYLLCYDASAGSTDKDRKVNVSKFAVLAVANAFTTTQSFSYAAGTAVNQAIDLPSQANGTGWGPFISIGRNTNGSTPAPGWIRIFEADGGSCEIFPDNSGIWRTTEGNAPSSAVFPSATVVGSQSSSLDTKDVISEFTDYDGALAAILAAPLYDFTYKNKRFNGEKFTGIITDYSPIFGMDRDVAHPGGKALNEVTAFGYTAAAIKAIIRRIEQLEGASIVR